MNASQLAEGFFTRPEKPVENSFIESFNGRLRDECLSVEVFFTLEEVGTTSAHWQKDYNQGRPHSSLNDEAPAAFAANWRSAKEGRESPSKVLEVLN